MSIYTIYDALSESKDLDHLQEPQITSRAFYVLAKTLGWHGQNYVRTLLSIEPLVLVATLTQRKLKLRNYENDWIRGYSHKR